MIVAALSVTESVSYGVLGYAFAVLLVPMQRELGWSRTTLTGAYSLALGISALTGLLVGRLLDRPGGSPRALMTAGSALAALAVLGWSRVTTIAQLYLVFAIIGASMAAVLYEPAFTVITKWFATAAGRRRALTALTLLAAPSSLIFSPLTQHLTTRLGWRGATAALAALLAAVTVPLHALVLRRPPPAPTPPGTATARPPATPAVAWRTSNFWLLTGAFTLTAFTATAMVTLLVALLHDAGHPPAFAALAAGLVGIAQLPGRLLLGLLGSRLAGPRLPAAVFGLGALALAALAVDRSAIGVVAFALAYGMSNGMATLLRATLPGDLYGATTYGAVTGAIAGSVNASRAAAPFAAAALTLLPGGSTTLLWLLAAATTLAAAAGAAALRHGRG